MNTLSLVECAKIAKEHGMTYGKMQEKLYCMGLKWEQYKRMTDDYESPFVKRVKEECRKIREEKAGRRESR